MKKPKPVQEKRQSVRFRVFSLVKCAIEPHGDIFQATNVRNVSRGGLTFFSEQEIQEGAILRFYFLPPNREKPVEARGKIVWRLRDKKNKKIFEMGVQFLEIPEDAKRAIRELEASFLAKQSPSTT